MTVEKTMDKSARKTAVRFGPIFTGAETHGITVHWVN